jgi:xanthine dehydrogenase YagS FAD-binding subunit
MTILKPGEIVTAVRLPKKWAGAKFYFEKVTDRATWDFALVNVAAALHVDGDTIKDARIVCGAVECVPRRLKSVEQAVIGQPKNEDTALIAGRIAAQGATPVQYNGYKVPLMENLVRRAVRDS